MNPNILTDFQRIIHTQITLQEALLGHHCKASAMLEVLLASSLTDHSTVTLYDFLWGLSDMICQAKTLNEELLNILLKAVALMEPPRGASGNTTIH